MQIKGSNNEFSELEDGGLVDNVNHLHALYSSWFSMQQPDPTTGEIKSNKFYYAAHQAAAKGRPASLSYLLRHGIRLDRDLIKAAVMSHSTQILQVLLDHGWNINEAQAYCEPPPLAYVAVCIS